MKNIQNSIIQLEYSEKQGLFHFNSEPENKPVGDWIILGKMHLYIAIFFCEYIEKKFRENYPDEKNIKLIFNSFYKYFIIKYLGFCLYQKFK